MNTTEASATPRQITVADDPRSNTTARDRNCKLPQNLLGTVHLQKR